MCVCEGSISIWHISGEMKSWDLSVLREGNYNSQGEKS